MNKCIENENEKHDIINRPRRRHGHKYTKYSVPR